MTEVVSEDSTHVTKEELISTFEEVLADYGVISNSEMEEYVQERLTKAVEEEKDVEPVNPHEARDREAEAAAQAAEETHAMTIEQLREVLPADVFQVVANHLSAAESPVPDPDGVEMRSDVEKAIMDARRSAVVHKVGAQSTLPDTDPTPSHENTDLEKDAPVSRTILSRFDEMESRPVRKSKDSEGSDNPAFRQVDEADL